MCYSIIKLSYEWLNLIYKFRKSLNYNSWYRITIFSFLILLLIFTNFPITANAYSIRSHTFCKDLDTSQYPYKPINPTNVFYTTEENAIFLVILDNVMVSHVATLKWIGPNGKTLSRDIQMDDPKSEGLSQYTHYSLGFSLPIMSRLGNYL